MAKSKKRSRSSKRFAILIAFIIGFVAGFIVSTYLNKDTVSAPAIPELVSPSPLPFEEEVEPEPEEEAEVEAEPEDEAELMAKEAVEEPTEEPTVAPTAEPTPAPTPIAQNLYIAQGMTASIRAEYNENGKPAMQPSQTAATFTIGVKRYIEPDYYQAHYLSRYELSGTEAAVEFSIVLNEGPQTIRPQDVLKTIGVVLQDGTVEMGYQLVDREIGENSVSNPEITLGAINAVFKRFEYSSPVKYLRVSAMSNGIEMIYDFEVGPAVSSYTQLQKGDNSEGVAKLQAHLIALGYLTGDADGKYGQMTEDAVSTVQSALGMTQTGVADPDFQKALFAIPTPSPAPTAVPTPAPTLPAPDQTQAQPEQAAAPEPTEVTAGAIG